MLERQGHPKRSQARPIAVRHPRPKVIPGARTPSKPLVPRSVRPWFLLIVMVLCGSGLTSRLIFWQVLQHGQLAAASDAEHAALYIRQPLRGKIYDANGVPLATDVSMHLVYAVPHDIRQPRRDAELLNPILHQSVQRLEDEFGRNPDYVELDPAVGTTVSRQISNLNLPGITLYPEVRRDYPNASEAAQVLGYVDASGKGYFGVEQRFNQILTGTAGERSVLHDTAGNSIRVGSATSPAHNGGDVYLTLDSRVQALAQSELQKAVAAHHADSGTVIIMNPHTGDITSMASDPTYDPNHYAKVANNNEASRFANPAISDQYEPGSTFKVITMSAGIDSGVITPSTSFYDNGAFHVANVTIHNWNMSGFGQETMTQVLQHSANVGASWVAEQLGTRRFYDYLHRFRLGRPTGIQLAGEARGQVIFPGEKGWTVVSQYTNSFGQGIAVTPLQLIRAIGAVANHGVMMKPQIVKQTFYQGHLRRNKPVRVARVMSARSAHTVTDMLVHSAVNGEAALALVKGYNIAAKTGTSNVAGPDGGYLPSDTVASIIGWAPAFHPKFIILVVINHPRDTPWGSIAAAPVLHNLFQDLFVYYHIPPNPHALYK
ncbi:MAG: peptidoglycan D,D-transpeptidase FtsI family protein [Chloroflexota bacterium]